MEYKKCEGCGYALKGRKDHSKCGEIIHKEIKEATFLEGYFMTIKQYADVTGISRQATHIKVLKGILPSIRIGKLYLITCGKKL